MIQKIKDKIEENNNDEYFYLMYLINANSGFFVNKNKLYYAIKNFQNLEMENINTDLLSLQTDRYISTLNENCSLKSDNYNLIEFKDDIDSDNLDAFINLCIMHANIAEKEPLNIFFNSLINLFQIPREQQFKNIIGLYGELSFIIYFYENYKINLTPYWHQTGSNDSYDFKLKNIFIELKTTLKNEPKTKIKHNQIFNSLKDKTFLGIIQIQDNVLGKTIQELVEIIKNFNNNQFSYEFLINLEKEKRKISINDYKNKKMSITNLKIYKVSDLETIKTIPSNISDIEYFYDFSSVPEYVLEIDKIKKNL